MAQRGRKSAASLAVVSGGLVARLAPPPELSDVQRSIWLATVNARPADWFGPEHAPMLVQYVRHVANASVIAQQLAEFDSAWLGDDDGLKRYDRLSTMLSRETASINTMARSMRLTHQSIYRADKAATLTGSAGRKPWQTLEADEN